MAQSGDWITPRLYGTTWFEKPVLYYWAAGLGFKLQLPAEWAARLPSALAASAASLALAWLARKHYGVNGKPSLTLALLAPLLFATTVAAIGFSRAATPDMLFSASITLAMVCAAAVLRNHRVLGTTDADSVPKKDAPALAFFGIFLATGALAKGPAAIVLAVGAIGTWALAVRRWRVALRMAHPIALLTFAVVALPWYIVCAERNPDFIHVFIFQHNLERYVSPIFQHRQPFWFFVPITLLAAVPWVAFLLPAAREAMPAWRGRGWRNSPTFFFSCWAMFPILFFSFSQSKLPSYVLPGIPALALILAVVVSRLLAANSPANFWIFTLVGLTWLSLGVGGLLWLRRLPQDVVLRAERAVVACAILAIAVGIAIIILSRVRQRAIISLSVISVCAILEIAGFVILPKLDPDYSARPVGTMLRSDLRPDRLFEYNLPRSWHYGVAFYLGRELPEWTNTDEKAALVLTTQEGCGALRMQELTETCESSRVGIALVPVRARTRITAPTTH